MCSKRNSNFIFTTSVRPQTKIWGETVVKTSGQTKSSLTSQVGIVVNSALKQ